MGEASYRKMGKGILLVLLIVIAFGSLYRVYRIERERIRKEEMTGQIGKLKEEGFGAVQLAEVRAFPVAAESVRGQDGTWSEARVEGLSYEDSFGAERSYGGERQHEGTDIMAVDGRIGYYPVISMTAGVVVHLGWLELGGYRVGVRSDSGVYYYYAHLDSYRKDLEEGMKVEAGDLLGFLGDTGYGEEGTRGQFEPHLHLGVYLTEAETERAINPYPLLEYAEKYIFSFCELENR